MKNNLEKTIIIRGGGEMGSAVAYRLFVTGFKMGIIELPSPLCIRRTVSFCEAVFEEKTYVENVKARLVNNVNDFNIAMEQHNFIPILIDPYAKCLNEIKPYVFIDATLAKKNIITKGSEAPLVIGLGPGFTAGVNCNVVIETNRGHYLGRVITNGAAQPNTGVPGNIQGQTSKRVFRAPAEGIINTGKSIGDSVEQGELIGKVEEGEVKATITGMIRGLIRNGTRVHTGQKIGDIDPRNDKNYINYISDKGRTVSGGVLEAVLRVG